MIEEIEQLRYPIGKFTAAPEINFKQIKLWIEEIDLLPEKLRNAADGLSDEQLDTPYRPGGWTLRQVIHHLPDSHMNAYIRFKLAYTQQNPTILPYMEERWAECADAKSGPVNISLDLLASIHKRWVMFLKSLNESDFERTYYHPENGITYTLKTVINLYVWHGEHHLQHILVTRRKHNW